MLYLSSIWINHGQKEITVAETASPNCPIAESSSSPKRPIAESAVAETAHRRIGVAELSHRRTIRRRIVLVAESSIAESAVAETSYRRIGGRRNGPSPKRRRRMGVAETS